MSRYPEFDCAAIADRPFVAASVKVQAAMLAQPPRSGASFGEFLASLPHILAGDAIRQVANAIVVARRQERAVIVSCGGHVIKCGLAPVLIELMRQGLITAVAVNGAVAIHDAELALFGATSEYVDQALQNGTFGMARDTALFYNGALQTARREGLGAGETLGRALLEQQAQGAETSLLAQAYRLQIPLTVHIAIGTDIVHMHPSADGAALGDASLRDFRILTAAMQTLPHGGVTLNLGSAVILPEILLKAFALWRNRRTDFTDFLGVDLDFASQYRANQQLVQRVQAMGGRGIQLIGHHEIMIPLLAFAVMEAQARAAPDILTAGAGGIDTQRP